jgi:hypothetical protein
MSYPHDIPLDHAKYIPILFCLILHSISLPNFEILNCLFAIHNTLLLVIPCPSEKFLAGISQPNTIPCPFYCLFAIPFQHPLLLQTFIRFRQILRATWARIWQCSTRSSYHAFVFTTTETSTPYLRQTVTYIDNRQTSDFRGSGFDTQPMQITHFNIMLYTCALF